MEMTLLTGTIAMAEQPKAKRRRSTQESEAKVVRDRVLKVFLTSEELRKLRMAAGFTDESQTDFLRKAAIERATEVLASPELKESLKK